MAHPPQLACVALLLESCSRIMKDAQKAPEVRACHMPPPPPRSIDPLKFEDVTNLQELGKRQMFCFCFPK